MSQAYSANYWLELGASAGKLNIGLPLYGRSFTLQDRNITSVGAPARAAGRAGRFTQEDGYLSFYEVIAIATTLMPNTHRRLRRDETGLSRRVGGVYMNSQLHCVPKKGSHQTYGSNFVES